jgi:DNA-binding transcriptional ArsR family regulator
VNDSTGVRWAWERQVRVSKLPNTVALVAFALATYANGNGTKAHPGIDRLAEGLGLHRRTVERSLSELVRRGFIVKDREGNHRRGHADEYRLTVPDHPAPAPHDVPDRPAVVPPNPADHPALESHDPWDHAALESDHAALESRSPGAGAAPQVQGQKQEHQNTKNNSTSRLDPWAEIERELAERDGSAAAEGTYVPSWQRLRP